MEKNNTPQLPSNNAGGLIVPDQILPPNLFVLPINGPIVFPTLMAPLLITQPKLVATIEEVISRQRILGLLLTREDELRDDVKPENLYDVGVAVKILKRLKMPDGSINLLVLSMKRFRSKRVLSEHPHLVVEAEYLDDIAEKSTEVDALTRSVISHVKKLSEMNPFFTEEIRLAMINAPGPSTVADLVAFALALHKPDAQEYLETLSVKARFEILLRHLRREQDVADLQKKISDDVNGKVTKAQREFFLREQMKAIKRELGVDGGGGNGPDKTPRTFRDRIEAARMPEDVKRIALEELDKFESISDNSPEHNITRNYLETLCSLPWSKETFDNLDLDHAQKILDDEHFGLEKVKERIIELLAVRKLTEEPKGSIICLVGPPGVGKTSIGKSIAAALGRKFFRFSLGGMRDEAEIKGHRRTYIGAMPSKVIQGIKRAGTKNCVLMLDEIDKLGQSYQGDPASALLEVLDPEQNHAFLDHYLDIPFDLSKVLFIATANTTASIPPALLDRMEIIELPGYTLEEKESIARKYVIPRELKSNGLHSGYLRIKRETLRTLMKDYAREPGMRTLQQLINRIVRKAAARIVRARTGKEEYLLKDGLPLWVNEENLSTWVGPKRFYNEMAERIAAPGVVVGLAWTSHGGDILFIEATDMPGAGNLKLTGQMGEVMTESAAIAWSYIKKKACAELGIDHKDLKEKDIHLHIPAGAIPKDGPSAGITMASALYSLLSGRIARQKVAMTGELSLIGKVLPVGGIKEKLLAAKRAGIQTIILPKLNEKDLAEIPTYALEGMKIHFVSHMEEVFPLVLAEPEKKKSSKLTARKNKARVLRSLNRPAPSKSPSKSPSKPR